MLDVCGQQCSHVAEGSVGHSLRVSLWERGRCLFTSSLFTSPWKRRGGLRQRRRDRSSSTASAEGQMQIRGSGIGDPVSFSAAWSEGQIQVCAASCAQTLRTTKGKSWAWRCHVCAFCSSPNQDEGEMELGGSRFVVTQRTRRMRRPRTGPPERWFDEQVFLTCDSRYKQRWCGCRPGADVPVPLCLDSLL